MITTPEQIDLWRGAPTEHQRLEFKEAKTQFDNKRLHKYCVALANEGGGRLILGVADKPPRPVVGTSAFNNPVEMAAKLFHVLGFRVDIEEVNHPDGRVLVFHIPSRPRGTAYHVDGAYLMRSGQSLRERFHLPESKSASVSQVIAQAIEAGVIKPDERVGASRKFARYLPFWA